MRHGKRFNHLSRTSAHRKAMLANMASSLIIHKRIKTTVAKAKALRTYIEPLITKSKTDSTHSRRMVFSYLKDKDAVTELFREVSVKVADRPGGYTRIIKIGNRFGDNAELALIELVDYNENLLQDKAKGPKKTRRRRGGGGAKSTAETETAVAAEASEEIAEEVVEETEAAVDTKEEPKAEEKKEEPKAEEKKEEPKAEEKKEEPKAEEKKEEPKAEDKKEEPKVEEKKEEPKAGEKNEEPKAEEPESEVPKEDASDDKEKKKEE